MPCDFSIGPGQTVIDWHQQIVSFEINPPDPFTPGCNWELLVFPGQSVPVCLFGTVVGWPFEGLQPNQLKFPEYPREDCDHTVLGPCAGSVPPVQSQDRSWTIELWSGIYAGFTFFPTAKVGSVTVVQTPRPPCSFTTDPLEVTIYPDDLIQTVNVMASDPLCQWVAEYDSNLYPWIELETSPGHPASSVPGTGDGVFYISTTIGTDQFPNTPLVGYVNVGCQKVKVTLKKRPVPPKQGGGSPYNYIDEYNIYHRVQATQDGSVTYNRARVGTPAHGWDLQGQVIADGSQPKIVRDESDLLRTIFSREGAIHEWISGDDGISWEESEFGEIMAGTHPDIALSEGNRKLRSAFLADVDGDGNTLLVGIIQGILQEAGELVLGQPFTFKDDQDPPQDLKFADDNHHIVYSRDSTGVAILTAMPSDGGDPAEWQSGDDGHTWERINATN